MGPGTHSPHKEFGADIKTKIHFGGKAKWKPDNTNPPPGNYDIDRALPLTQKSVKKVRRLRADRMKRSDFTKQNIQDFPSGGEYFQFKSFDSDAKKFTFGGKTLKMAAIYSPPVGLYNPNIEVTKRSLKLKSVSLSRDMTMRTDFTKTHM